VGLAVTVIIEDSFAGGTSGDDLDGRSPDVTDDGTTWVTNGANTIELDGSGRIYGNASDEACRIDTSVTDASAEIIVNCGTNAVNRMFVFVRGSNHASSDSSADFYFFGIRFDLANELQLGKLVNGSVTSLGTANFAVSTSTDYRIKIRVSGSGDQEGYVDDVSKLTATDTEIDGSTVGGTYAGAWLRTLSASDAGHKFDDFIVDNLSAGGGLPAGSLTLLGVGI